MTAQFAAGIAARAFLVWVIIGHVMPFFGVELVDMARAVVDLNLPARVAQLFGVNYSDCMLGATPGPKCVGNEIHLLDDAVAF